MAPQWLRLTFIAIVLMTQTVSADAQTTAAARGLDPIRYTVSFPAPHTHYMEVSAIVPTGGRADVELMMAVWTPGSYLVREYSRHIERVTATGAGGRALAVEKSDKNRWKVTTGGAPTVTVAYRVYAREMSVRTNWVEARFALVNGAPTFMTLADNTSRPHEVILNPADGWIENDLVRAGRIVGERHERRGAVDERESRLDPVGPDRHLAGVDAIRNRHRRRASRRHLPAILV